MLRPEIRLLRFDKDNNNEDNRKKNTDFISDLSAKAASGLWKMITGTSVYEKGYEKGKKEGFVCVAKYYENKISELKCKLDEEKNHYSLYKSERINKENAVNALYKYLQENEEELERVKEKSLKKSLDNKNISSEILNTLSRGSTTQCATSSLGMSHGSIIDSLSNIYADGKKEGFIAGQKEARAIFAPKVSSLKSELNDLIVKCREYHSKIIKFDDVILETKYAIDDISREIAKYM